MYFSNNMNIIILGSGGSQTIPRPCCKCNICQEARIKGIPYSRNGPSIFIEEINTIFDTPKDIINSVNRENIYKIDNIVYTHWHPDHTEGMRIVEEITKNWSEKEPFVLKNHNEPINIYAPRDVINELVKISSPEGSYFKYFISQNLIKLKNLVFDKSTTINNIKLTPVLNNKDKFLTSSSYIIEEDNKKVVFMPCDLKPFIKHDFLKNTDLFIVGSPFFESENGLKSIPENHPLRDELFSMEEIVELINKYKIKQTVIIHLEEMWRLNHDDYVKLEKKYEAYNIKFAYDGLKITV